MCPCSHVYTVEEVKRMGTFDLGLAVWEYVNDQDIDDMAEEYGSLAAAAAAAVDCFLDDPEELSEATAYISRLGAAVLTAAVYEYLETEVGSGNT